jgi:hypothetical protein
MYTKEKLVKAQEAQKHQADKTRKNSSNYKVEDLV